MTEAVIQRQIMRALSDAGATVFRNNVGQYKLPNGNMIRYGICNPGGSDVIGWYSGRFLACEVKTSTGKLSEPQINFLSAVRDAGGIAIVARSAEEAVAELRRQLLI